MIRAQNTDRRWVVGMPFPEENPQYILAMDSGTGKPQIHKIIPETVCHSTELKTGPDGQPVWENDHVQTMDDVHAKGIVRFGLYDGKHWGFYIHWLGKHWDYRKDILYWLPYICVVHNGE